MSVVFSVNKSELPDANLELELYEDGKSVIKTTGKTMRFNSILLIMLGYIGLTKAIFPFVFVTNVAEPSSNLKTSLPTSDEDVDEDDVFLPSSPHKQASSRPGSGRALLPSIGQRKVNLLLLAINSQLLTRYSPRSANR